jgi:multiple sugar transport system substrate-binding protein
MNSKLTKLYHSIPYPWLALFLLASLITSCGQFGNQVFLSGTTATPVPTSTFSASIQATSTPSGPLRLNLLLPPQFDPAKATGENRVLQLRLEEFISRRPDIKIETRTKTTEGPGGLLDWLASANSAAPLALPDLVALPRPILEKATQMGLLHAYDGLTQSMEDSDWYESARQLARAQNSTVSLPFALDNMLLIYRPDQVAQPPTSLENALLLNEILAFPASDPQSLYVLLLYLSAGGAITDDQGKPYLNKEILSNVLILIDQAHRQGIMPSWLTQHQSYEQTWSVFMENQADMTINWASQYFINRSEDINIAPVPAYNETIITLSTGWGWAVTSPNAIKLTPTIELAEFLIDPTFLAKWSIQAGFIPPKPSSLSSWQDSTIKTFTDQITRSAVMLPSIDILSSIGPALSQATIQVIKDRIDPRLAAEQAVETLTNP